MPHASRPSPRTSPRLWLLLAACLLPGTLPAADLSLPPLPAQSSLGGTVQAAPPPTLVAAGPAGLPPGMAGRAPHAPSGLAAPGAEPESPSDSADWRLLGGLALMAMMARRRYQWARLHGQQLDQQRHGESRRDGSRAPASSPIGLGAGHGHLPFGG